jgi:hypothetical protein
MKDSILLLKSSGHAKEFLRNLSTIWVRALKMVPQYASKCRTAMYILPSSLVCNEALDSDWELWSFYILS